MNQYAIQYSDLLLSWYSVQEQFDVTFAAIPDLTDQYFLYKCYQYYNDYLNCVKYS